ncbi:MAG TPA: hypothetical protein VIL16_27270 [Trebonia sp.]
MQAEFEVVVPPGPPANPVDQDHVGVIADGEVRGVPGGRGQPLQVRPGDLPQPKRPEHGKSQVKDADAEPVLTRRVVLVEEAEPREGGDVAVRGTAGETEPLRQFADTERRSIGGESSEDGQAALE